MRWEGGGSHELNQAYFFFYLITFNVNTTDKNPSSVSAKLFSFTNSSNTKNTGTCIYVLIIFQEEGMSTKLSKINWILKNELGPIRISSPTSCWSCFYMHVYTFWAPNVFMIAIKYVLLKSILFANWTAITLTLTYSLECIEPPISLEITCIYIFDDTHSLRI